MVPYLPGEITDVVIAHVSPDSPSLCSCALVHSQWLPASRYYLFLAIQIDNQRAYTLFIDRVLRSETMRIWLKHTRELRVLNAEEEEVAALDAMARSPAPFGKRFLYEFAGQIPRLQSLELFHVDFASGGFHSAAYVAFSQFCSLETLALTNCLFPSFTAFRRLLAGLPSLRELALSNVHWHPVLPHHSSHLVAAPRRPLLESLFIAEIDRDCARVLLEWLDHTTSSQTIRSLSFEASLASINLKSFQTAALSPTDVHIWLYDDVGGLRDLLPQFAHMRSLRITAPDLSEQSTWIQLSEILEVISSPEIRTIAINGFMNGILEAELVSGEVRELLGVPTRGLERVEEALKRGVFEHLTALDVQLEQWIALPLNVQAAQNAVLEVMRSRLPSVFERGIATFGFQFTRAIFCGLPQSKEEHKEGTGMQGWMVMDTQRPDH